MLSKKNYSEKIRKVTDAKNKYSIRKLSIGAASALIGISFLGFGARTVHADAQSVEQKTAVTQDMTDTQNPENPHNDTAPADVNTWKLGNDSKSYDGNQITKIDAKNFKLADKNDDHKLNTTSVDNDSFEWVNKDGQPVSKIPKDVGTYNVKLTDSAVQKLKKDNPNLTEDPGIVATYTIKQGQATATLRGYDSKAADDKSVTTDDLNKSGKIYVNLDVPGSTETKYQLKDGDYSWYKDNDQVGSNAPKQVSSDAPKNVGTYYAKFTDQGIKNITDYINGLVGSGTELVDGVEKEVPNVTITFADSTTVNNKDSSLNATFTIYDPKAVPSATGKVPKGAVWTPAGWTNSNPEHVAKSASVKLYQADRGNGKNNLENDQNPLNISRDIAKYNLFGTNISVTIDKNDLKIGNRILLAAITSINDYTLDPNEQLKFSVASTENGRVVKDNSNNIIGKITVTKLNNGEIDYWLDVTATDTYGEDVKIKNLKDYETGYINHAPNFSKLANLSKNGRKLQINDRLTQTLLTASGTYTQVYTVTPLKGGLDSIPDPNKPNTWSSGSKPIMSVNYVNPALNKEKRELQNLAGSTEVITPTSYYKVFFIQGKNINFNNLTSWERLEISPVDDSSTGKAIKQIYNESSDTVNDVKLDKNLKKAIKLGDNLAVKDLIAETPDGQTAYSMLKDDSAIVVIKVNPDDTKLNTDEITQYVESSRHYNMRPGRRKQIMKNTHDFYDRIGNQSLRTAVMISTDLQDVDSNDGWSKITDITPNANNIDLTKIPDEDNDSSIRRYQHGQATADTNVFRTAYITYKDGDKNISNEVHVALTGEEGTTETYSVNIPLGYKFEHLVFSNQSDIKENTINENDKITNLKQDKNGNLIFDYAYHKDKRNNPNVFIYLSKIPQSHNITYTVYDDDAKDEDKKVLTENTQLPDIYMLDSKNDTLFDGSKNSNADLANSAFQKILNYYENDGYKLDYDKMNTEGILGQNNQVNWTKVKANNYNFAIYLKHATHDTQTTKLITRKIKVDGLSNIISSVETQTTEFTRTAIYDDHTGEIVGYRKGSQTIAPSKANEAWEISKTGNKWENYNAYEAYTSSTAGYYISSIEDADGNDYSDVLKDNLGHILGIKGIANLTSDAKDQEITIHFKENRVDPTKPESNPDPNNSNWFKEQGLTKQVTRTINYKGLSERQLADIPSDQKSQTVSFIRTALYDWRNAQLVTGSESEWTAVDDKNTFAGFTPYKFVGYTADRTVPDAPVKGSDSDSTITITYTANDQTGKISYQDENGNEIGTTALSGKTDAEITVTPVAPAGWKIVLGQDIPKTVKATAKGIQTVIVKIKHKIIQVTPENPIPNGEKVVTGEVINGAHESDLNQTITRTINVTDPNGKKSETVQTAKITRTASYDDVTGEVTYDAWTTDSTNWKGFKPTTIPGYTVSQAEVPAVTVTDKTQPTIIDITYTANDQTGKISYQDENGKEISTTALSGKTDAEVTVTPVAPTGWEIVGGQDIPKTVQATANGVPTVVVKIEHATITVNPGDQAPTGPVPGDPDKNYEEMQNLTVSPTRTINITMSDGKTKTITQTVNFNRTATFDEVTGKVTYSEWSFKDSNASDKGQDWDAYTPATVAGYTPTIDKVLSQSVTAETENSNITITYSANDQSTNIVYKDSDGKVVKIDKVSGKTGQTVDVKSEVPAGWKLADGQSVPATIKFGPDGYKDVTITIEHKIIQVEPTSPVPAGEKTATGIVIDGAHESDLNQTITRTINITDPIGKKSETVQTAKITRTASYDDVTGEVNYDAWTTDSTGWTEFKPAVIPGYTVSQADVPAVTVTDQTKPITINITYTAKDQSVIIKFIDDDSDKSQVGSTITKTGKTAEKINDLGLVVPDHYELAEGQTLPTSYTFAANNSPIEVHVRHKHKQVTDKNTVIRTIVDNVPGQNPKTTTQKVEFTRTGDHDLVTNATTWENWVSPNSKWLSYTAAGKLGYTPNIAKVDETSVSSTDKGTEIIITYAANPQTNVVTIIDDDSKAQVGTPVEIKGVTDGNADWQVTIPENYELVLNNMTSGNYTFAAEKQTPIEVHVRHKHAKSSESESVTRTIITNVPGTNKSETPQVVNFTRTIDKDLVSGTSTYGEWVPTSIAKWNMFTVPVIKGYTPDKSSIAAEDVTATTADQTITINYTENVANVNFDGNASSTYGQPLKIADLQNKLALDNNEFKLSENDFDWYQNDAKLAKAPENVGTYTVQLKDDVLAALHTQNDNYRFQFNRNKVSYTINQADLAVKLTGNGKQQKGEAINLDNYAVQLDSEMHKLSELNLDQNDLVVTQDATEPSHYLVSLKQSAQEKLQALRPNHKITFANEATLDVLNKHKVQYLDEDGNVVNDEDFDGKDQEKRKFTPRFPRGWMLISLNVPTQISIDGNTTQIYIKHAKTTVKADDPKTSDDVLPHNAEAHYPTGVDKNDLNKTVTRKIIVNSPDGQVKTVVQKASFTRDAEVDEVTGDVKYLDWKLDKNELSEYQAPKYDGYHADLEKVNGEELPSIDSQYKDIEINYVADEKKDNSKSTSDPKMSTPTVEPHPETKTDNTSFDYDKLAINDKIEENKQSDRLSFKDSVFSAPLGKDKTRKSKKLKNNKSESKIFLAKTQSKTKDNARVIKVDNKQAEAYTVKPKTSGENAKKFETIKIKNAQSTSTDLDKNNKQVLPKTGEKDNTSASWLGMLLSVLGLSGFAIKRKKKD